MSRSKYTTAYCKGWDASSRTCDLDGAERRFMQRSKPDSAEESAWMDGYMDYAVGRPKYHFRDCEAKRGECIEDCPMGQTGDDEWLRERRSRGQNALIDNNCKREVLS